MKTKWFSIPILVVVMTFSAIGIGIVVYYGWWTLKALFQMFWYLVVEGGRIH